MKKYFVLFGLLVLAPMATNAAISTTDTIDPVVIRNQGYSNEASDLMQRRARDQLAPEPVKEKDTVWKGIGKKFIYTVDPTFEHPEFGGHNIEFNHMTVDDL